MNDSPDVRLHIVPYRGKFAPEARAILEPLATWSRGILPRPALGDVQKALSPSQKKILKALIRQAIHE